MSQEEYETKLRNVHRFIPFLENMITQLKDPKMKNREQQLSKMESLYQMITDKNKKLKLDTLNKCEEVIIKLFYKVKGENATLPPVHPRERKEEKRKPIDLYSIAGETINRPSSYKQLYGGSGSNGSKSPRPKSFPFRKPPISYSDLECLEKDVAHELEKNMSLHELNSLKNHLCKELEESKTDAINTTVRNKPVLMRMNAASPDKNRRKVETAVSQPKNEPKKDPSVPKKNDPKLSGPKVLKEAGDIFGNAFSEIDKTYEMALKKKEEKKVGKEKKDNQMEEAVERASLKHLSEKAALLRNVGSKANTEKTDSTKQSSSVSISNEKDAVVDPPKVPTTNTDDDPEKKSTAAIDSISPDKVTEESTDEPKKEKGKSDTVTPLLPVITPDVKTVDPIDETKKEKSDTNSETHQVKISNTKSDDTDKTRKEKSDTGSETHPVKISNTKSVDSDKTKKEKSKPNPDSIPIAKTEDKDKVKKEKNKSNCDTIPNAKTDNEDKTKKEKSKTDPDTIPITKTDDSNNDTGKQEVTLDATGKDGNKPKKTEGEAIDDPKEKASKEKRHSSSHSSQRDKKHGEHKKDKAEKSEHKKDKTEKSEHRKHTNDRSRKSDHKKDKDDKCKDKNRDKSKSREKHSKPAENKDAGGNKDGDSKKDKNVPVPNGKEVNKPERDADKEDKSKRNVPAVAIEVLNKINSQIDKTKGKTPDIELDKPLKGVDEPSNAQIKPESKLNPVTPGEIKEKPTEETKPINRDPRLKYGQVSTATTQKPERLAFKYNPKPKRQEIVVDLEKNVLDSIEKSMKESQMPLLPPPVLAAPPRPPDDLFSPESPDEIDKAAVPPLLNDLLLNPKTTGMINEVVSALRRSNNENNLISIRTKVNSGKNDAKNPNLPFSPPVTKPLFEPPSTPMFPTEQLASSRLYNPFSPTENTEIERTDYLPMNQSAQNLNPFEDRTVQSFYMERTPGFVPPSPSYGAPSNYVPPSPNFVPPSPSFVPPSPLYEGNAEMNYQMPNPHFFEGDRGPIRPKGHLGEAPNRLPYNNLYGQHNYSQFNRFGQRGCGNSGEAWPRPYAGPSRDPRMNANRGHQFPPVQETRPMFRESRMTYRQYKEQKERENREREMREKEIREKEAKEKEQKEREEAAQKVAEDEAAENKQKESEKDKVPEKVEESDRSRDRTSRSRDRSRDRYSRNRSASRYRREGRRDREERRDRSKERPRYGESKFDKVYSARGNDKDPSSPLDNLFAPKSTGQYKIPKKVKEEEKPKPEDKIPKEPVEDKKTTRKSRKNRKNASETNNTKKPAENKTKPSEEDDEVVVKKETDVDKSSDVKPPSKEDVETITTKQEIEVEEKNEEVIEPKSEDKDVKQSKPSERKEEEENILSKFFQNLMKSGNKDEKKGALLSLISTFSDSFSDQQLQKITSIIRSEDVDEEPKKGEGTTEKEEVPSTSNSEIELNQKESITEDGSESITEDHSEGIAEDHSESIAEDRSESIAEDHSESIVEDTEEKIENEAETQKPEETPAGKIKNRRKSEIKSKVKGKSELDRLHDDIREMFIRDGVVTATGKRMCRILKDTSASPSTENEKTEDEPSHDEMDKKIPATKKRGRKLGNRKNKETSEVEMKELTVVLPKMSLDKMKLSEDASEKEKSDREEDNEEQRDPTSDVETSDKEIVEKTSPVRKGRQKKRNSWAAGVIKKKPGPKSRKQKAAEKNGKNKTEDELNDEEPIEVQIENPHEIDYYLKAGQTKLQCKYCDVATKWIAAHYRTEHQDKEVLSSRLAPYIAKAVIADAIKNKEAYENDDKVSMTKHEFLCVFCDYKQLTLPKFYRDHVSIHTGEFRYSCPYCSFSRSHIKTMQMHVDEVHADEEAVLKKPVTTERAPNNRNIYAYICQTCNYTQMSLENVKRHVETYHEKCDIYKIKMNQDEKIEEEVDAKPAQSERATRRSAKLSLSQEKEATPPVSEAAKASDVETVRASDVLEDSEPIEADPSKSLVKTQNEIEGESTNETERQASLQENRMMTRKRAKSFSAPSPAKKRLKRRCTVKVTTDREPEEKKQAKNVEEAVFTSNTDIQEENKRIEEERLKTMQDINSTIKLRTSLDFVEKLSHRLKQEEEVIIKQEAEETVENVVEKLPVGDLPVFEKSGIQNRETEPVRQETCPKTGKVNPINGVIEKLQGILGNSSTPCEDSPNAYDDSSMPTVDPEEPEPPVEVPAVPKLEFKNSEPNYPPPLIHMDSVEQTVEKSNIINSETLNIGYVKVMKTTSTYIYVCCLPPCIYSSRDRTAFANHCQFNHQWNEASPRSTQCLECGEKIEAGEDFNLLSSALNHVVGAHSDFLGVKIGSIRISSNLFPESKEKDDDFRYAEVTPLTPPTISIPSPQGERDIEDVDCLLEAETVTENDDGENPFSFKIVDVVSLADQNVQPLNVSDQDTEAKVSDKEPDPCQFQHSPTPPPPQSMNKTVSPLLVKFRSKQPKPVQRKSPMAMKKFLGNHFDLYKCPDFSCLFTTNKRKMFDIHLRMHPNHKKLMNCLYCDKLILFEYTGDHYEKFHGMCRFSCSFCLYRCIAKDYMDIHQLLAHPDMPSRMQLLPKRDSEDQHSISILSEATKSTTIVPYACCNMEFIHQAPFLQHVTMCPNNPKFVCFFNKDEIQVCQAVHDNPKDLVQHWGTVHGVYPLKCAYCDAGDFDLNSMMIHLVLEHPTLPPDIIDRYNPPINKSKKSASSVQCNFKQLVMELKSASVKNGAPKTPKMDPQPAETVSPTTPSTMQKAFEHFALQTQATPVKTITYSKIAPLNIIQNSPPSLALLKPTSKANVINGGGLVYCLSPAPQNQNSVLKAIVVNKEGAKTPQKVQLVAPPNDGKFQIVSKIVPLSSNLPKLAPLTGSQVGKVNDKVASCEGLERMDVEKEDQAQSRKNDSAAGDVADMYNLEEPMVVIDDDLAADKDRQEAVDPLSLETDDPPPVQPSKSPRPGATPTHEYDSDSKDVDHQDVLMQKTGLVGYQLFRCAKCDMFFAGDWQFKEHLINSTQCKYENSPHKPYKCFHCGKYLKHYTNLLDHLGYHGHPRFTCSLCNKKFPHPNQARYHMKTQHNVLNVQMQPLVQNKSNLNNDSFIAKPQVVGGVKQIIKETTNECDAPKSAEIKTVYYSFEADQIPQKSILGYDITCGHCKKFKNKVRSNIVRHLLLHQNDKDFTVPDTAPVNPVPCLEKNEKMFDKMYNLASSSHTGGRMGGQQKGETKKDKVVDTNHPAFVPSNKRYQCCAVGCNYLCLEEGNLRHHLTALHMEDLSFVCVHCKRDLSDAVDVDTIIKHLKLHDLHLYKCSSCDYMHNLKHKIERHIGEDHKGKESTVVVIRAMDAEPYDENQQQLFAPAIINQKLPKPWRCCMCKYKCQTEEEVVNHVTGKHNIDCRYKCALCTFKANDVSEFKGHFTADHRDNAVDIISVYCKDDETVGAVSEGEQFDTTPLWLRDKPRVRHIRGILFEEDPTVKKKSAAVKSAVVAEQAAKESPGTANSRKRKRSMSTVSELNKLEEEEETEPKKEVLEPVVGVGLGEDNDIIVIEDDDKEEPADNDDKAMETVDKEESTDVDLICTFGDFGMPLNKHFKCPKCEKYRTTKMREFIQHVAGELRYHRFICTLCDDKFITLENIQMHCIDYHDCSVKSVVHLPKDEAINKWLTLLLTEQRNIIKGLGFACDEIPDDVEDFLGSLEITSNKAIKCKECGFSVSGPTALDRHMKYNHPHIAFARAPNPPRPRSASVSADKKRRATAEAAAEAKKMKMTAKSSMLGKDKYVCKGCGAEFDSVPEMEYHAKDKHDEDVGYMVKTTDIPITCSWSPRNILRCRYCPSTGTRANLENHIATDHPGQKLDLYRFSCGVCLAKFEMLKSFRQHFKSHELPNMFYYDVYDRRVDLGAVTMPTAPKQKMYKCPVCPYVSKSVNSANLKHHLKTHAKPLQCELCKLQFRTKQDAKSHHSKEHPHNPESIVTRQDMIQKIQKMMEEVMRNVKECDKVPTDDSLEEDVPTLSLQPEVILQTGEDDVVDVESLDQIGCDQSTTGKRYFARKSTGSKQDESKDYYSFYGQKSEPVDMKRIITNFEVADAQMKMSCDQLGRIYNLNPVIRLKDCMTLIIDDDEEESS